MELDILYSKIKKKNNIHTFTKNFGLVSFWDSMIQFKNITDISRYNGKYISHALFTTIISKSPISFDIEMEDTFFIGDCILMNILRQPIEYIDIFFNNLSVQEINNRIQMLHDYTITNDILYYNNYKIHLIPKITPAIYVFNQPIDCLAVCYYDKTVYCDYRFIRAINNMTIIYNPNLQLTDYDKYTKWFSIFTKKSNIDFSHLPIDQCNYVKMLFERINKKCNKIIQQRIINDRQFSEYQMLKNITNNKLLIKYYEHANNDTNVTSPSIKLMKIISQACYNLPVVDIVNIEYKNNHFYVDYGDVILKTNLPKKEYVKFMCDNDIPEIINVVPNNIIEKYIVPIEWISKYNLPTKCIIRTIFRYTAIDKLNQFINDEIFNQHKDFIIKEICENDYVYIYHFYKDKLGDISSQLFFHNAKKCQLL